MRPLWLSSYYGFGRVSVSVCSDPGRDFFLGSWLVGMAKVGGKGMYYVSE